MRATRSPTHRGIAALATYWLAVGASFFLLLQLCERECQGDNLFAASLGLLFVFLGVLFGLAWLVASRREGRRGFAVGAIPGLAVGALIVVLGSTPLLASALFPVGLILLIVGVAATVAFAARER